MFLLDTDICSYIMKRSHPVLLDRVREFGPGELRVSVVTAFELEYGARRSGRYPKLARVIGAFFDRVTVLPWDRPAALHAGRIRAELSAKGRPIGAYGLLIAGHARSESATLVTHNTREFSRLPGLRTESWTR